MGYVIFRFRGLSTTNIVCLRHHFIWLFFFFTILSWHLVCGKIYLRYWKRNQTFYLKCFCFFSNKGDDKDVICQSESPFLFVFFVPEVNWTISEFPPCGRALGVRDGCGEEEVLLRLLLFLGWRRQSQPLRQCSHSWHWAAQWARTSPCVSALVNLPCGLHLSFMAVNWQTQDLSSDGSIQVFDWSKNSNRPTTLSNIPLKVKVLNENDNICKKLCIIS